MLHLDWLDYAERLLGPADWTDAASVAALYARAQALLPSDLLVLPVARIAAAHIVARPALRTTIAGKPAAAQPLRALLADGGLREMIAAAMTRLQPIAAVVALGLPAPAEFARAVAVAAGLPAPPADDDLADDAAVYTADFLRAFKAVPLGALVLDADAFPEFDAPIVRIADHYGWQLLREGIYASIVVPADTRPEDAAALVAKLRETV